MSGKTDFLQVTGNSKTPTIRPWGGEEPTPCHQYFYPPPIGKKVKFPERVEAKTEVAVVGAGLSGLTAAYQLRDRELIILEADARPGGVCKGAEYRGCRYPEGAAYFLYPTDEPWRSWYRELGLEVEQARVAAPASCLYYQGHWYPECFFESGIRKLPISPRARDDFLRLSRDLAKLDRQTEDLAPHGFHWQTLDQISFQQYLEVHQGYSPELTPLLAPYCRSCLGAEPGQLSAWAVLYFLMSECSPEATSCAFPEGDARLATTLLQKTGPGCLRSNQVVVRLQVAPDAIRLLIWDKAHQDFYLLQAAVVILGVGKFAIRHLLAGIPGWDSEIFQPFRYSCYLVAAFCGVEDIEAPGFENWVVGEPAFSDFVFQPRHPRQGEPRVLVIYAPQPFPPDRQAFLAASPQDKAREISAALENLWPGICRRVEEIRLYRYGHAQIVPYPGFLSRIRHRIPRHRGRVILAHSDLDGLPCVESAMLTGQHAARLARKVLPK